MRRITLAGAEEPWEEPLADSPKHSEVQAKSDWQTRMNWDSPRQMEDEKAKEEMEDEFDGVLREEVVAEGLSVLGRSAPGSEQAYLNLVLQGCNLSNVKILSGYVYLQTLDLSHNNITDLSCISHMPYLLQLNASNNDLRTFFDFKPPRNLKEVNFSFNQITDMKDLSACQALTTLILDSNNISEIKGLHDCFCLTHLSIAFNRITEISGLTDLPIRTLCLSNNEIVNIRGLESLRALESLDLSSNNIMNLDGLEGLNLLQTIDLKNNQISELRELRYLEDLPLLRELNLLNNPIKEHSDYWLKVLFMLQRLHELDGEKIKVEEKVAAVNKHGAPPEVVAAQDHMSNIMYNMIQPQKIFDSTLPSLDAPYPMLVLTGPQSCGKRELTHRLCRQFKDFFRYGACHTTREPYFGEEKRFDYHFISEEVFDEMTCMGVRSLKNTYFEPRYILVVPMNKEKYEGSLRRKGLFSRPEIELAVSRVDMYMQINQDLPGFFDAVINVDDLDEAYVHLSRLIKEYLGLTEQMGSGASGDRIYPGLRDSTSSVDIAIDKTAQMAPTSEFLDSAARKYSARVSAKLAIEKSPIEEASVQRRQQAARQALVGKPPSAYTHLFERSTVTAPAILGPDHRLLDPRLFSSMLPSGGIVTQERSLPGASREASSQDSGSISGLSIMSSAGVLSAEGSFAFRTPTINILGPEEDDMDLLILAAPQPGREEEQVGDIAPEAPQPLPTEPTQPTKPRKSASSRKSSPRGSISSRPGSNKKPVLPPIPSGRKMAKT